MNKGKPSEVGYYWVILKDGRTMVAEIVEDMATGNLICDVLDPMEVDIDDIRFYESILEPDMTVPLDELGRMSSHTHKVYRGTGTLIIPDNQEYTVDRPTLHGDN